MIGRILSAVASIAMLILLSGYVLAAERVKTTERVASLAVLAPSGAMPASPQFTTSVAAARAAVLDDPLNQRLLNIAMVAGVRERPGPPNRAWFKAMSMLGWRDTTSRQNLIVRHALDNNGLAVLDDVDGLLRRNQLIEQVGPVLLAMEVDPSWRLRIVERLRQRPAWRFGYLQRGDQIDDPGLLKARAATIRMLQATGDRLGVQEIAPVLSKLLGADLGSDAYAIWHAEEPSMARPVADPMFAKVAVEQEPSTVPFHWQLTAGPDYGVDAIPQPVSHLAINWNGSGAPIFASQTLATAPGKYAVILTHPVDGGSLETMIGVRAICRGDAVDFTRTRRLSPTHTAYYGDAEVACAYPRLELFGRSGEAGLQDRQVAISGVAISSI